MARTWFGHTLRVVALAALCVAIASPADAQLGSLRGRVVDAEGNPVELGTEIAETAEAVEALPMEEEVFEAEIVEEA